ncbi:barnase inhibitor [Micromonospora sp. NPDC049523]|uniref:barnase inhibitor n=1 Tax=Micromonospora sp. NPDC049523 TaxID=3155921 RepID=UPI00341E5026
MLADVAAFDRETDQHRVDYHLMMRSPVRMMHSRALLDDTVRWLREHDYHVVSVDASWMIASHMFRDLASALGNVCHDQWQCLSEGVAEAVADTWDRHAGFVLVLHGFDVFVRYHREAAQDLLDVIAEKAWPAALLGKRVICLVQTDDPDLRLRPVGMSTPSWTDAEWSHASRGL